MLSPPVSLCLLITCGHVCTTEEMQSFAPIITICLVCKIYIKYMFIRATSLSVALFLKPSLTHCAHSGSISNENTGIMNFPCFLHNACVFLFHKCTGIMPCTLLLQERVWQQLTWKKERRFYIICFSGGEKAGGKCIFSSHVIIVAR